MDNRISNIRNATPWTESEEAIIKSFYVSEGTDVVARLSGRSKGAVKARAQQIGIRIRNRKRELHLTDTEKAYIAAIIDAEGWIGFTVTKSKKYPTPRVGIANTNLGLIEWLKSKFADLVVYDYVRPATETQKECHYLQITQPASVQALLEQTAPYMLVKRERAELVMEFTRTRINVSRAEPYTVDPEPLIAKIRELNKKGPVKMEGS